MQKTFSSTPPDPLIEKPASTDNRNRKEADPPANNASKAKFNNLMKASPKDQAGNTGQTNTNRQVRAETGAEGKTTSGAASRFAPDFTYARDLMMSRLPPEPKAPSDAKQENLLSGERERQSSSPEAVPMSGQGINGSAQTSSSGAPTQAEHSAPTPQSEELTQMLERLCSDIYVSSGDAAGKARMYMALDAAIPGAAVEFVRDGAFMYVRLHATNETAFRLMSQQREDLQDTLRKSTNLNVSVEVIQRDANRDSDNG